MSTRSLFTITHLPLVGHQHSTYVRLVDNPARYMGWDKKRTPNGPIFQGVGREAGACCNGHFKVVAVGGLSCFSKSGLPPAVVLSLLMLVSRKQDKAFN